MSCLKVEDISCSFGGLKAVFNVSFKVQSGEIMGLIGPNGAGKTTTLNLISGLYKTDYGHVFLGDRDISSYTSYQRARLGIGRTFQTPRFLTRSSIEDNMKLGADLFDQMGYMKSFLGFRGSDFKTEVEKLLEIADLTIDNWHENIDALSYGKQKQLEIIRSLLSHPKALLVDEPAAGLNARELERSVALLRFAVRNGACVIMIEHKMDMVMRVCDHIVVLNFGEVIANGTPKEVSSNEDVIEAYLGRS